MKFGRTLLRRQGLQRVEVCCANEAYQSIVQNAISVDM